MEDRKTDSNKQEFLCRKHSVSCADPTLFENCFTYAAPQDLNMYYCGKRERTRNHRYGPEIRMYYLVVLVREGQAVLHRPDGNIPFGTGDLFVMFPGECVHYEANPGTTWSISWIGMYGNMMNEMWKNLGVTPENPLLHLSDFSEVAVKFDEIFLASADTSPAGKNRCIGMLYDIFASLMAEHGQRRKNDQDYVQEALTFLSHNFERDVTVGMIAENLHIDRSYLARVFRAEVGISPKEYLLSLRVQKACELLASRELSVKALAASLGYGDQMYFARFFRKKIGCTPTEYRNRIIQKAEEKQ